jgi:predicted secreted protein
MKLLLKGAVIIFLTVFFDVSYCQKVPRRQTFHIINLTENDSGKTLTVSPGQTFTLTLPDKVDGGYRFDPAKYDASVLRLEKHLERSPAANNRLGNPGQDSWRFTSLKKGKTTLKITASRPWVGGGKIIIFKNIIIVKK